MTFSKTTRTLVGSTALAAAFAMPLMAQEAPETSPEPETPVTQAAPDAPAEDMASAEAIENGTAVAVTSDDAVIGQIQTMTTLEDGTNRYEIALADAYEVEGGRVAIQSPDRLNAEGELELQVTEQEFAAAVRQQLGGGTGMGTETQTN
ncbi:hypothetical protein BOO69_00900 [Sulfitobacter alexandrii]|uniref:PRC-barrel domain-containing protein n=1 Tax=Sulfitobacter alexandrii TaxID=1917485 RepID=A0A1J0WCT0_9RHOB|nr:hypothetical protein [Sulfitobacter alexandrii]APE42122.1 hypothetical protein BOO69_00900 [Sulfitobacter alexandrii]